MSFKLLQFSPETSTRAIHMRATPDRWTSGYAYSRDTGFVRSWLEDDSEPSDGNKRGMNWGAISGLIISLAISGSFWMGVGYLIARMVK